MITVFIPTANRPKFLQTTLESVALQSRRDLISAVLVSENGGCRESKQVADSFSEILPIQWLWQDNLPIHLHALHVLPLIESSHVALLADDDIWSRYHLEEAARCFEEHPDVVGYFGQTVCVDTQTCQVTGRFSGTFDQILDHEDQPLQDFFIWSQATTAVNSLTATPLNIWSCVARKDAYAKALTEASGDPVFGSYPASDSLFIWRLACAGPIAHGRNVSLFYRVHSNSDMRVRSKAAYEEVRASTLAIRKEIARQCKEFGTDAVEEWKQAYARASHQKMQQRIAVESRETRDWILYGSADLSRSSLITKTQAALKNVIVNITPPILLKSAKGAFYACRKGIQGFNAP